MTRERADSGTTGDAEVRPAATVMLLHEGTGDGALQVYLLRRTASMRFAPGMHVFPGGGVDERDTDSGIRWAGPPPSDWARRLETAEPLARALVCAAVRETFEESGVLLAGPPRGGVVADTRGPDWEADREALVGRSLSFTEFLRGRDLVLRSDLLRAWSRWVTPPGETRRFDTRFFAAALPEGQRTRDVGGEADRVAWMTPADALAAWRRGDLEMLPPTVTSCAELADCDSVAAAMAARRTVFPIRPEIGEIDGEPHIVMPDGVPCPRRRPR
ncbi:NUDIX hydrolase [Streptomonospora salina]|uniref:8-oxo-dGTP pyrophosphatase MutT (NUDIX family) n=1 Tax=Streptomonospora salina TaxID=104205 RepID=A0A841EHM1_9ACTN|nr:NUDIX domain-containing protein [Streptomonospora salina]MBB5998921.1 8-oxo-dGTP pyrophosphatase MutT (NUDIX family) [Streptomonospora salina]